MIKQKLIRNTKPSRECSFKKGGAKAEQKKSPSKQRKVEKMTPSLSCLVTLSYSSSHSISCSGFHKFVVRDDVISPTGVRNFKQNVPHTDEGGSSLALAERGGDGGA